MQGPNYPYTEDIIKYYLKHPLIEGIVLSCWETDPLVSIKDSRLVVLYNEEIPVDPGVGNRNRQIYTSKNGLKYLQGDYCAKMRTDQKITHESLSMMDRFYKKFKDTKRSPISVVSGGDCFPHELFVLGMYTKFPFHPRDHVFWGEKMALEDLFNIPYDLTQHDKKPPDYSEVLRAEAFIGMYYYARFAPKTIGEFIKNPKTYLVDNAPKLQEAIKVYNQWREFVFKPFPRIQMDWPKHHITTTTYPFERNKKMFSEYWHDEVWE